MFHGRIEVLKLRQQPETKYVDTHFATFWWEVILELHSILHIYFIIILYEYIIDRTQINSHYTIRKRKDKKKWYVYKFSQQIMDNCYGFYSEFNTENFFLSTCCKLTYHLEFIVKILDIALWIFRLMLIRSKTFPKLTSLIPNNLERKMSNVLRTTLANFEKILKLISISSNLLFKANQLDP